MYVSLCVVILLHIVSTYGDVDVDVDYYYSSGLRTQIFTCSNSLKQLYCQSKCIRKLALCIQDSCYCSSIDPVNERKNDALSNQTSRNEELNIELVDSEDLKPPEIPYLSLDMLYALRPSVRHHIAHFCPDLEVARQCIRKCMVKGKPAFCGKDHVCYCGHKYEHTVDDKDGDAEEMYAQFKDLYKKYFGTTSYVQESVEV